MKSLSATACLILAVLLGGMGPLHGSEPPSAACSEEDRQYAKVWNDYYDPEDARAFGLKIQKLVGTRNLTGLFELVDGELTTGPRKKFVKEKSFADIFPEEWRVRVLASTAPCAPVGWRGFMLASGAVWFNRADDGWRIFAINGARQEEREDANLPIGWKMPDGLIPPQCFVRNWVSSDNFEEFEKQFAIQDPADFRGNPGKYLGAEISRLAPLTPSWGGEKLVLAAPVDRCLDGSVQGGTIGAPRELNVRVSGRSIESKTCTSDTSCTEYAYSVLARVSRKHCQSLAPNLKGTCQAAFLVAAGDYAGGSMGWDHGYNIYGLFTLENGQKLIVPLKNFNKKNDAINYIETSAL